MQECKTDASVAESVAKGFAAKSQDTFIKSIWLAVADTAANWHKKTRKCHKA